MFFEFLNFFPNDDSTLAKIADFFLDSNTFFVPLSATHLELRAATSGDSDPLLVQRWELNNFFGYNRYLRPIVESDAL